MEFDDSDGFELLILELIGHKGHSLVYLQTFKLKLIKVTSREMLQNLWLDWLVELTYKHLNSFNHLKLPTLKLSISKFTSYPFINIET